MRRKLLSCNRKVLYIIFGVILTATFSCTKTTTVSGIAINKHTGEGLANANVYLLLGQQSTGGFLGTEGSGEGYSSTISDSNGSFSIEGKSKIIEIIGVKEGYSWVKQGSAGLTGDQLSPGEYSDYTIEFEGKAKFNSPFTRLISSDDKENSQLKISLLSYDDLDANLNNFDTKSRDGIGPHYFWDEESPVSIVGDRYLRYKLEFTTVEGWKTVIDSVFIPTSSEVYAQPIYY